MRKKIAIVELIKRCFLLFMIISVCSCKGKKRLLITDEVTLEKLPEVIKEAVNGSIIYIKPGIYEDINLRISGVKGKKITIRPRNFGDVLVTGASSFTVVNCDNLTFEGFYFEKIERHVFGIFDSHDLSIINNYFYQCGTSPTISLIRLRDKSHNNMIYRNTFDDNRAQCVVVPTSKDNPRDKGNVNNEIFNNYFVNIPSVKSVYPNSNGNGMEAIQIGLDFEETIGYELNTKVYRNLFENIIGDGVEIISNKSSGNKIIENTFLNNKSGITIRSGNKVLVEGNYLENTTRGIRLYGADHVVKNNYIKNPSFGISLPSADFKRGGRMEYVGYFQQENIKIYGNVIENPTSDAFLLGIGERKLMPQNINISRNKIIVNDSSRDINISERAIERNQVSFQENVTISTNKNETKLRKESSNRRSTLKTIDQEEIISAKDVTGVEPFKSNDLRVGATWKRPIIKNN